MVWKVIEKKVIYITNNKKLAQKYASNKRREKRLATEYELWSNE